MRRFLFGLTLLALALLPRSAAAADGPPPELHYHLQVLMSFRGPSENAGAPDGSLLVVSRADDPTGSQLCTIASTVDGYADIDVDLSSDCPDGTPVALTLYFGDQDAAPAAADPPFVWRAPAPDEVDPITALVKPVPDASTGAPLPPAAPVARLMASSSAADLGRVYVGIAVVLGFIGLLAGLVLFRRPAPR